MRRRTTTISALAAAALLLTALTGCTAGSGEDGQTLHVIRAESFDGWDPDKAAAYATYQTLANVEEPLLAFGSDGRSIEPGIATKWIYDEAAMTWTFTLRDGVKFSDGRALTPQDVIFSESVWSQGKNYGSLYGNIASVTSDDPRTVVFHMSSADTTLPVLMTWSSSAIFPKDFGGVSASKFWQKPIGAGAYAIDSWSTGGQTVLVANKHYYDKVGVKRVVITTVTDANQGAALLQSGQADISEYVTPQDAEAYGPAVKALPSSQIEHLSFNTTRPPLNDPHVRRAIAEALDTSTIIKGAFKGYGEAPRGIIPSGLANWSAPDVPEPSFDLAKAKAELALAAVKPTQLEVVYDASNQTDNNVAQIIKQNLTALGIDLKLTPLETGTFLDRAYGLKSDLVLWSYGPVSPDVSDPLAWISGTSWLFSGTNTDRIVGQFNAYAAAQDSTAREAVIREVQDDAASQVLAAPVAQFQVLDAVGKRVKGFAPAPWGMYFWSKITLSEG